MSLNLSVETLWIIILPIHTSLWLPGSRHKEGEVKPTQDKLQTATYQVYGAAHDGPHNSRNCACCGGFDRADPAVGVDVTRGLDDGVGAEPDSIHEELIEQSGDQSFLQAGQSVHFADSIESVENVAIVNLISAPAPELSLQLHPRFDDLQRVGEQTRSARRHST